MTSDSHAKSADTFGSRLEMMVLAFIDKHQRRPLLVSGRELHAETMWVGAFVDAKEVDTDPTVHPKLAELARHGARAWRLWTKLEPDEVVLLLEADRSGMSKVTIAPRTKTLEVQVAEACLREMIEREKRS